MEKLSDSRKYHDTIFGAVKRVHLINVLSAVAIILMFPLYISTWVIQSNQHEILKRASGILALKTAFEDARSEFRLVVESSIAQERIYSAFKEAWLPDRTPKTSPPDVRLIVGLVIGNLRSNSYRSANKSNPRFPADVPIEGFFEAITGGLKEFNELSTGEMASLWGLRICRTRLSPADRSIDEGFDPPLKEDELFIAHLFCGKNDRTTAPDERYAPAKSYLQQQGVDALNAHLLEEFLNKEMTRISTADSILTQQTAKLVLPSAQLVLEIGFLYAIYSILTLILAAFVLIMLRWNEKIHHPDQTPVELLGTWVAYAAYHEGSLLGKILGLMFLWCPAITSAVAVACVCILPIGSISYLPRAPFYVLCIANTLFCTILIVFTHRISNKIHR